jgi:non-canonical purine NTP pyrophosphatase (RdgB/HAM1 family)
LSRDTRVVVIASRNADKLRELRELFAGLPFDVRAATEYPGLPDVIEDGTTLVGNACRKAVATAAYTGEIAVADDTGLRVPALGGLPDIFAARFAGRGATYADNCALLSDLMRDVPDGFRQATFETAVAWVDPRPSRSGLDASAAPGPGGTLRWLHNPFRRAIHLADPADEDAFWNGLFDRRAVWRDYLARAEGLGRTPGVDRGRLAGIYERLTAPVRDGRRPADAAPADLRLPDTRIWSAAGPDDPDEPTRIAPGGLPADAPGRAVNEAVWCELTAVGRLLGEVTRTPSGDRGFGYDPVFRPLGGERTLAELAPAEKNAVSHRGQALRRLLDAARRVYAAQR